MKSNIGRVFVCCSFFAIAFAAAGCEPQKPAASAVAKPRESEGVTRQSAILEAQRDAAFRHAELQVARVDARRQGGFWVVELTSHSGSGLRYTISAQDGSIRERNLFQ
ncbi:MAG: hypothetical protein IPK82_15660 [Polyangiaceae bacterium]|nr:hypothetical protein [Polyangiaceae bacterium]